MEISKFDISSEMKYYCNAFLRFALGFNILDSVYVQCVVISHSTYPPPATPLANQMYCLNSERSTRAVRWPNTAIGTTPAVSAGAERLSHNTKNGSLAYSSPRC